LKNIPHQCLSYDAWSKRGDVSKPALYVQDESRQKFMKEIQDKIRNPEGRCPVFRITGLSGLGKTRFIFETLAPDDLKNRVIYVKADDLKGSELCYTLQSNSNLSAIIVVDECDLGQHEEFVRAFSNRGDRLALITLSYEPGRIPPSALHYKLDPLSKEHIKEIIKNEMPLLPQIITDRIAVFADGYPRFAMLLAENFQASPGSSLDDLLAINDDDLLNRLLAGRMDINSEKFTKVKRVMMGLALFEKVGYKDSLSLNCYPLSQEAKWIAGLMKIDWLDFQEIVEEQKQRGVVQGEYYIYVTPFLLATHLNRKWWNIYGNRLDFEEFIKDIPVDLLPRFFTRVPFIATTEPGRRLVKNLLHENGIFSDGSLLKTELGARFFLELTEADPEAALDCLKRTVGTWSKEEMLAFTAGRRGVVWALEKIAVWKELFAGAARLLLALGEAENESYANNASGVFAGLFSPGPGLVAPTEASPAERFPVLVEAMSSGSIERKKLALRAFECALQSGHFSRLGGAEYQGGKKPPELWQPKTYGELFDAYRRAWSYLDENLENFDEEIRNEAEKILLEAARGLVSIPNLSEMVMGTLRRLAACPWTDKRELLAVVIRIIHYDGKEMPFEDLQKWIALRDELTGKSYPELLRRFVGMGLLEDHFDDEGKRINLAEVKIRELALEAVREPALLVTEYSWLTTDEAREGYAFGYELGKADAEFSLLSTLLIEQEKAGEKGSAAFLGGYLRALFEKNPQLWEDVLDSATSNENLRKWVPEMTWRSGMSDRAALRILELAQKGDIEIGHFGMFAYGGVIKRVSEPVFSQWAEYLLQEPTGLGAYILLNLFSFYYAHKQEEDKIIPKELGLQLLCHPAFFENPGKVQKGQMVEYYWQKTALSLLYQYPETWEDLADTLLKYFGIEKSIIPNDFSETITVLNEIAHKNPKLMWKKIAAYLGPPIDTRAFWLTQWLRGDTEGIRSRSGVLSFFDPQDIWGWVEEDVEKRSWYLATFVPPQLFRSESEICLARELLVRYGERKDVRDNLSANFSTEGWTGPASEHYKQKKRLLMNFKNDETDVNVLK